MRQLNLLLLFLMPSLLFSQVITDTTTITITKTWSQQPNGYTYPIDIGVPSGSVPTGGFPVCILLHGNGGTGTSFINSFSSILDCHVLVAPSGYMNSWNICDEDNDGPDMEMLEELINHLQTYTNINPNQIRILGFSNGSALANKVFIENKNPGVDIIVAIVSQLSEPQYHNGLFYYPSVNSNQANAYCGYDSTTVPNTGRKYLSICNVNDPIIPYTGGTSVVGVDFIDAQLATFIVAQSQGFTGNQINPPGNPIGPAGVFVDEFSYLSGQVVHLIGDAAHAINSTHEDYISNFMDNCNSATDIKKVIDNSFKVYPNPSNDIINIDGDFNGNLKYMLYTPLGTNILNGTISKNSKIDISHLSSNIYLLKINNRVFKIVKTE
ncbi:MAG: T9SS type A sorting domain-containing protein [Saprospiraceae bacterium]|nr:T9SS type A sorting domain-containing protein [Saprospiraceae bacterium]